MFLLVGGCGVVLVPVLAVLAIYGVRKYIGNAKTAEARNAVGMISKDAVSAYERELLVGGRPLHQLCASASAPVPLVVPRANKYQSASSDWQMDRVANAGFYCLKFEISQPQYYQYDYKRTGSGLLTGDSFEAIAHGDLNGDGVTSTFSVRGQIGAGDVVTVAPTILEDAPEE